MLSNKHILIAGVVAILMLVTLIYTGYLPMEIVGGTTYIYLEDFTPLDDSHLQLGRHLGRLYGNPVCNELCGAKSQMTFIAPDNTNYGTYTGEKTWPCEEWPDEEDVPVDVNIDCDQWGTWTVQYLKWERDEYGGVWILCVDTDVYFFIGDPITCYNCGSDGCTPTEQTFYEETCPDDWYPEQPTCNELITCYNCGPDGHTPTSQTFCEETCPEGWFPEQPICDEMHIFTVTINPLDASVTIQGVGTQQAINGIVTFELPEDDYIVSGHKTGYITQTVQITIPDTLEWSFVLESTGNGGNGTPGFELVIFAVSIIITLMLLWRRKHENI